MSKKIQVDLYHRWAALMSEYPSELSEELRYKTPNLFFRQRFSRFMGNAWRNMINRDRIPAGLFLALRKDIEKKLHLKFIVDDLRQPPKYHKHYLKSKREYQNKCVDKMQKRKSGGIVKMATGVGKTYIAALYFNRLKGTGVFVVDELTLLHQAKDELARVLREKVGIVGQSQFKPRRITVATIQTLDIHKKKKEYRQWGNNLDAALLDEVHVALNARSNRTMQSMKPKVIYGLTATLQLQKQEIRMKAYALAGSVCYRFPISAGIQHNVLSRGVVISVVIHHGEDEDLGYALSYKNLIVESKTRLRAIKRVCEECHRRGKSIVVLVERVQHLKNLSKLLEDTPHRLVYGAKSVQDRIQAKVDFQNKDIRLILTNKVFKKGINLPAIDVIIDAAASKSRNDAIQKYGRGIRISEGKTGLIYFDISDRSPEGIRKGDIGYNRFTKATGIRLRAFKEAGIPVEVCDYGDLKHRSDAKLMVNEAESHLLTQLMKDKVKKEPKRRRR